MIYISVCKVMTITFMRIIKYSLLTGQDKRNERKTNMSEKNTKIQKALRVNRVYAYELSSILGISVSTYNRMIREELPEAEQIRIVQLIEDYAAKRNEDND